MDVVTGVTASVAPASVGRVSVSGMKPEVRSVAGVGDGEYGTSGSTAEVEEVGAAVDVSSSVEEVAPVHATEATSSRHGMRGRARRMRTRRV
jgi:hypothetical protein